MPMSRRSFSLACAALAAGVAAPAHAARPVRRFHLSVSPDALESDPALLGVAKAAGVTDLWLTGFLYGYWHYTLERTQALRSKAEAAGLAAHMINVPLGHPGDSLGAMDGDVPLTPPRHWKPGVRPDGTLYAGTSLHPPATAENAAAARLVAQAGYRQLFLDDDFRLAQAPSTIGGCYCEAHRDAFLKARGYSAQRWPELLDAVNRRVYAPILREWLDAACDELTASFRAQQAAAPRLRLGIMVMYMGAEHAGIRLADYRGALFRVGEGHFDDASFGTVKGKTIELFSSLFHRRYARPDLAYSESTAYPADRLSAANLAAKLAVSTLSDVRHTMFMSGLTAFPRAHWTVLGPAMRRTALLHARVAGHAPRGPFKHYRGDESRLLAEDNPNSLFLASGIPFEVVDAPPRGGWVFLGEADARAAEAGRLRLRGAVPVLRPGSGANLPGARVVPEALSDLYALKRELVPMLDTVPYVEQNVPAVCAWYPTARAALVWNLSEQPARLTVRYGTTRRALALGPLELDIVDELTQGS